MRPLHSFCMFNNEYILSVSQLNEYVASMLREDVLLGNIGVRGEISGFKLHSSGHMYFSLKDDHALIRCTMFRQYGLSLKWKPVDGMQVIARGAAAIYVKDGQFQLNVRSMEKEGEGVLFRRFLELKEALLKKGFFDEAHKKKIPLLPKCLGVITSPTGAAIQDIIHIVRRRFPKMNIALCPVNVQGEGAGKEIAEAIRYMNRVKKADVLIVGRGGGSLEDLWAFNEEIVARAIYESELPIVSAVGHETDFSIADFVADMRAPTPSAAAELCVPEYGALMQGIEKREKELRSSLLHDLQMKRTKLDALTKSAGFTAPRNAVAAWRAKLAALSSSMQNSARNELVSAVSAHGSVSARLEALSPSYVLQRGYAMVRKRDGTYASGALDLQKKDGADIVMRDGTLIVTVDEIKEK